MELDIVEFFNDSVIYPVIVIFTGSQWLQSGVAFLLTFIFASSLTWLINFILKKISTNTNTYLDDVLVKIIRAPVYYSLMMLGLSTAVELTPLDPRTTEVYLISIFKTIGVIIWMVFAIRVVKILLKQLAWVGKSYQLIQPQTIPLFDNLLKILIVVIASYIVFHIWDADITGWLASAGIIGLAIGFAAKDTLANLFSGAFILADAPYKIGDYVVLTEGERGKVTTIGLRSTRLLTRDDIEITVPNSIMGNSKVINQSGGPHSKLRIRVKVGVAYNSDIDQVREILLNIAANEPLACENPSPRTRFRLLGASSLDFELLCWIENPELRGRSLDKLYEAVYKRFNEANIEIPFNQYDVRIRK